MGIRSKSYLQLLVIAALSLSGLLPTADQALALRKPSLTGSWELVSRTRADSTVVADSLVFGRATFTESTKHLSVSWKNADGKWVTVIHIAKYTFDGKTYSEENIYYVKSIAGRKDSVVVNNENLSEKVSVETHSFGYWFEFPLFDRQEVYFQGRFFEVSEPDSYVDRWNRTR